MSFERLQLFLSQWPGGTLEVSGSEDDLLRRLASVFADRKNATDEWLPILRQALARESSRQGSPAMLRIPKADGWPVRAQLQAHGLQIVQQDDQSFLVQVTPWYPAWLGTGEVDLFADACAELPSRAQDLCDMDPLLREATGFDHYMSAGQRAAIHAVLMAPPGSTLVVTLPTGSGKSLVAQAPPLLAGEGACTIVVVPTIALAMDQARQFGVLWRRRHPTQSQLHFAWHSDMSIEQKRQVKQSLRRGQQPILFTSPESVVGSLRMAIQDAALRGYLRYLVVDEAHLVAQWGDSFRPEFQSLAAFQRGLAGIAKQPFKTVLMTATLTSEALSTIETLFAHASPVQLLASVHLRTEPRYWYAKAASVTDQESKVLELLAHAPRPLMLYVTEVEKAKRWGRLLGDRSWRRYGVFHGETGSRERRRLIDEWATGQLDVMVATAAFGVGIDKRDVRCVIHACVPESLDRYYQEVGRGGRDGKAMCAIAVYTDDDARTAEGIAVPSLITSDLGLPRWRTLLQAGSAVPEADGVVMKLDLATVAPNLNQQSDYNRAWNLRTLMMMARAQVIELTTETPTGSCSEEVDEPVVEMTEDELRRFFDRILVRILNPLHLDETLWSGWIETTRANTMEVALKGVERIKDVFAGRSEMGRALQNLYSIREEGRRVLVDNTCSGCPVCRAMGDPGISRPVPIVISPFSLQETAALQHWKQRFLGHVFPPCYIFFDEHDPQLLARVQRLALQLSQCGLREVRAIASDWPGFSTWAVFHPGGQAPFVAMSGLDDEEEKYLQVPRLTLLRNPSGAQLGGLVPYLTRPFDWVLVPFTFPNPYRQDRRLADTLPVLSLLGVIETLAR